MQRVWRPRGRRSENKGVFGLFFSVLILGLGFSLYFTSKIMLSTPLVSVGWKGAMSSTRLGRVRSVRRTNRKICPFGSLCSGHRLGVGVNRVSESLLEQTKLSRRTKCTAQVIENKSDTNVSNFIRAIIDEDLKTGATGGRVMTRFPPEPNGYLHIGHAKSICLNFGLAEDYKGICNLRFDDTNPLTEDVEYVDSIINDVKWLGFDPEDRIYYASDYFEKLYSLAVQLIEKGLAYVDLSSESEIREARGTVKTKGTPSPYRDTSPQENLELFAKMRNGEFKDGEAVLRAKIDMDSPNMLMRDPLIYRIKHDPPHHKTKDKWCIYPMYDFAHPLSDAIENITHSICTLEFDVHRPLYDWLVDALFPSPRPHQYEMGRLNLDYTVTSKRKLLKLVEDGKVSGWDDPRMPTIAGIRRRGIPPSAIRRFCEMVGVARSESRVEIGMLEAAIRDDLAARAPRVMAVLQPLKVVLTNWEEGKIEMMEAPLYSDNVPDEHVATAKRSREIPLTREIYIEKDDFMIDPPKKYFRLRPGGEVRLRYGYIIKCEEVITDPKTKEVIELRCTYDPETKSGSEQTRKVKGTIHWVSSSHGVPMQTNMYNNMLSVPNPDQALSEDPERSLNDLLNPASLRVLGKTYAEPFIKEDIERFYDELRELKKSSESSLSPEPVPLPRYQFERQGFFALDHKAESVPDEGTSPEISVNRIVGLRDTWAKIDSKQKGKGTVRGSGQRRKAEPQVQNTPPFQRVDLRVGKIVDVWEHPDAEKLWCEKIDLGESDGTRTIVSGLRAHYSKEQLMGKKVVVFANLKPSKLRGIQSQGMVLAASNEDHSIVQLLEPPSDSKVGDKVACQGEDVSAYALPDTSINPKAKTSVWPKVQEKLIVNSEGVPLFDSTPLVVGNARCTVESLKDATIG